MATWQWNPNMSAEWNQAQANVTGHTIDPQDQFKSNMSKYTNSISDPAAPSYLGLTGPNGQLQDQFKVNAGPAVGMTSNLGELQNQLGNINLNTQGLDSIRQQALNTSGPSAWGQLQLQRQANDQSGAQDALTRGLNSGVAGAYSQLGARGGVSAGARERIASKMGMSNQIQRQDLARTGESARLGILTQDEQNRLDLLKGLPGMETQALQPALAKTSMWGQMAGQESNQKMNLDLSNRAYNTDVNKANVGSLVQNQAGQNEFNQNYWGKMKDAYGSMMQSQAQQYG